MKTQQPTWKLVAQFGDVHPIDYGGLFVYEDETGVYPPEAELLEVPEDGERTYYVYRFILEPCTYIDGILSDNPYHKDKPAWFAGTETMRAERPQDTTYLKNIADSYDITVDAFATMFCSEDVRERAEAWRMVGEHHGFINLDSYPLQLTRAEVKARYK